MNSKKIRIQRAAIVLEPDQSRVLLRPFRPGDTRRIRGITARITSLPENQVRSVLANVLSEFSERHHQIRKAFLQRSDQICSLLKITDTFTEERRLLIGACFLAEYSLESAALFNPSIIAHPDQSNLPEGSLRFIISLRATGEGHISSITFRTGTVDKNSDLIIDTPTGFLIEPQQVPNAQYENALFERKLSELGLTNDFTRCVMSQLSDPFEIDQLFSVIDRELKQTKGNEGLSEMQGTADGMLMLAQSNCEVQFDAGQEISERVIFPTTYSQKNGIEDARFVQFQNDDGTLTYYATFTAYDGKVVMPELIETSDFLRFRFITLNGPAAKNKGMAVFPRKINGHYAMISRQDNENIFIMFSDNIHFWNERTELLAPMFPWEIIQIGNCGSPIETDAGWLVLSHGVGPLRKYCIGAFLLDLEDPTKVIGRLREPLLIPNENEREGYVPNIVYTCGFLLHNDHLIIPYGLADYATGFATVPLQDVLAAME